MYKSTRIEKYQKLKNVGRKAAQIPDSGQSFDFLFMLRTDKYTASFYLPTRLKPDLSPSHHV
jgi:hypothetical protein